MATTSTDILALIQDELAEMAQASAERAICELQAAIELAHCAHTSSQDLELSLALLTGASCARKVS